MTLPTAEGVIRKMRRQAARSFAAQNGDLRATPCRAHLETSAGPRTVPVRSPSLGRGRLENSGAFSPAILLRTGTVRGPAVAVSRSSLRACRFLIEFRARAPKLAPACRTNRFNLNHL